MLTTWGADWDYYGTANRCCHTLYPYPCWLQEASIITILATCKLEFLMNFFAITLFIGMITCFLERPLVVMLIFGLTLSFEPLITLCIFSIFLLGRLGNIFLILSISLAMFFRVTGLGCLSGEVAFAYNFFCWELMFFLKYFDNSLTSFCDLAETRGGIEEMKVGFTIFLPSLLFVDLGTCGVNLDFTLFLKVVLALSI